jgi:hypothetical protein
MIPAHLRTAPLWKERRTLMDHNEMTQAELDAFREKIRRALRQHSFKLFVEPRLRAYEQLPARLKK